MDSSQAVLESRADAVHLWQVCLEEFDRNPADFGRTVMSLLERDYGVASLQESLRAPVRGQKAMAEAIKSK